MINAINAPGPALWYFEKYDHRYSIMAKIIIFNEYLLKHPTEAAYKFQPELLSYT